MKTGWVHKSDNTSQTFSMHIQLVGYQMPLRFAHSVFPEHNEQASMKVASFVANMCNTSNMQLFLSSSRPQLQNKSTYEIASFLLFTASL